MTRARDDELAAIDVRRGYARRHDAQVIYITLGGMIVLSMAAMTLGVSEPPYFTSWLDVGGFIFANLFAAMFGTFIGCVEVPIALWLLHRKNIRHAAPIVLIGTYGAVLWYIFARPDIWQVFYPLPSAVIAFVMYPAMCLMCRLVLPNDPKLVGHKIYPECGYDLQKLNQRGCPECGWGRSHKSEPGRPRPD